MHTVIVGRGTGLIRAICSRNAANAERTSRWNHAPGYRCGVMCCTIALHVLRSRMDTTIRNLDDAVYRRLKASAALSGKTVGEAVNEALRAYLARPESLVRNGSLRDLVPEPYPDGNERLSQEIDAVAYGR